MKTPERKRKKIMKTVFAAVCAVSLAILAGCGGGVGSGPVATGAPSFAAPGADGLYGDAELDIYYDLDVESQEGLVSSRAALDSVSNAVTDILDLKSRIESLPNSAFMKTPKRKIRLADVKRKRLEGMIGWVKRDIRKNRLRTAVMRIDRKIIPRVDGCSGGREKDDYILDRQSKLAVYNSATEIRSLLVAYIGEKQGGGRHGWRTALVTRDEFINNILNKINDLQTYINNLPAEAFTGAVANPRETLLEVLTLAANYAADGEFGAVKEELEENFAPYVDGLDGDDLIVDAAAALEAYNMAQAIIDEVTVTSISISPESAALTPGGTQEFTALCTYSNQYTEDCTELVVWTSSDPAVGGIDATGVFTAAAVGTCVVNAELMGVTSNDASVEVNDIVYTYLEDDFDAGYVDPEKWNDFTNYGTIAQAEGLLKASGPSNMYSELATTNYFNIEPGEFVSFEVDLSLWQSSGQYYMMGFGITDKTFAGIAIGLAGGTTLSGATLYYASPLRGAGSSTTLPAGVRSGKFRVEYQNGQAQLYRDGALVFSFQADLDGKRVSFFMFASAGWGTSFYNTTFDNLITNQLYPGETGIKIANNTTPFGADGSGMFVSGDSYTITVMSAPGQTDVRAGIIDPSNANYLIPMTTLAETTPGVYETTGNMPSLASGLVAADGTDDGGLAIALRTRKIATSGSAAPASRIAAMAAQPETAHPLLNIFPADILPSELAAGVK